ncbi:DUF6207 family protein [Streptomyces sp. DSM 40750]|uniref:DUF6207 family protein n=2 Tax=Streptomyces sp. DSM 40750 TaxID=2801030 RepID=UPI0027D478CD|nr:DUF6207 family protein [Streptomyces sp. DSM 40750]
MHMWHGPAWWSWRSPPPATRPRSPSRPRSPNGWTTATTDRTTRGPGQPGVRLRRYARP